ncbi:MAG TPA: hypothetical protein VN379_21075 [Sporomusa sp.]|nr:hypothetical protein [Sporomusa sp.]
MVKHYEATPRYWTSGDQAEVDFKFIDLGLEKVNYACTPGLPTAKQKAAFFMKAAWYRNRASAKNSLLRSGKIRYTKRTGCSGDG